MTRLQKSAHLIYTAIAIVLPLIMLLLEEPEQEPILIGNQCDLKNTFVVKYCQDDKKVIGIEKKISGPLEIADLKIQEDLQSHKSHKIVRKLMCLKFAYGCPKCLSWARSFTEGICKYCGGKLKKSKYWSEILVIFDRKICLFSGIFPHIKE